MSFGSITNPAPIAAVNYFVTINQLSARNTQDVATIQEGSPTQYPQWVDEMIPYTPFILFSALFIAAFGIQVVNRVKTVRSIITAFFIAIFAASIPATLTYIEQGSRQQVKAGPQEVPREIRVSPKSADSILIEWKTDAEHLGMVRIGTKPLTEETGRAYVADNKQKTRVHSVEVPKLIKGETYELEIYSGRAWYDDNGKYIQFTF